MAFGEIQTITAPPQPGTSNEPYPVGNSPAFVPVTCTVTDTYGAAIEAQTDALIVAGFVLSGIGDSLATISNQQQATAKALHDLSIAIGTLTVATEKRRITLTMQTSSDIQKNTLYVNSSNVSPTLPSDAVQIRSAVTDGIELLSAARVDSMADSFINSSIAFVNGWIASTGVYSTIGGWLSEAGSALLNILPDSVQSLFARTKSDVV